MSPNTNRLIMMLDEHNDITSQSSTNSTSEIIDHRNGNTTENDSTSKSKSENDYNTRIIQLHRKRPSSKKRVLLKIRSKMEDPRKTKRQQNQRDTSSPISYSSDIRRNLETSIHSQLSKNYSNSSFVSASNYSPPNIPITQQQGVKFENHYQHYSAVAAPSPIFNRSQNQFMNTYNTPSLNNGMNQSPNGYSYMHSMQQRNHLQPYEVTRRCMELRLIEEGTKTLTLSNLFSTFRRRTQSADSNFSPQLAATPGNFRKLEVDAKFDIIRVSWYSGTTSSELQDHVRCAITRKIGKAIMDFRILDLDSDEEIVLSPYIPDGSKFLVRYSLPPPVKTIYDYSSKAPYSPSRALTPVNSDTELDNMPDLDIGQPAEPATTACSTTNTESIVDQSEASEAKIISTQEDGKTVCTKVTPAADVSRFTEGSGVGAMTPEMRCTDPVTVVVKVNTPMQQLKYVIWVIAKSFISFLTIVRICAELYERSPVWKEQIISHLENVEACAVDRDSLFECVSRGDFSGLMASFVIWITSKTTRRFFLFGFDSVQTLYHCVYEAFVSSFCWGCSYMFIRRGLNPDTRTNCLLKYWKDCAYGTLANFFQNFIKTVLKNLIPKEAVKEAFGEAIRATTNTDNKFGIFGLGLFRNKVKVSANDVIVME